MPSKHYYSDIGVEDRNTFRRPVRKCYSRPGISKAVTESRIDSESDAILIRLSAITCIAALVVVYGGWSF